MTSATASELSKKTKILRQTIYEILDRLSEKGLISFGIRNNVKYFEAANPKRFNEILKEKKEILDEIIPKMEEISKSQNKKPLVEVYEGIEGLKTIYSKIIRDKPKELLELGDNDNFTQLMKLYFVENYMVKRVQNKTRLRLLTDESAKGSFDTNVKQFRETRFNKLLKGCKTANYIYDDILITITFEKQPLGVLIKNKLIVDMQKLLFENLWKLSKN